MTKQYICVCVCACVCVCVCVCVLTRYIQIDVDGLDFDDSDAISQLSSLKRDAKSILNRYSMSPLTTTTNGPKHMTAEELDHKYGKIVAGLVLKQLLNINCSLLRNMHVKSWVSTKCHCKFEYAS